jgi:glycosyltransferase involved in cell wall biosynthesis
MKQAKRKKFKIALFSTPWEAVPPKKYGGTELVVYNLAQGLVRQGHSVVVFTTGDSCLSAKIDYIHQKSGFRAGVSWLNKPFPLLHSSYAFSKIRAGNFDLVHNHYGIWGISFAKAAGIIPFVTTYHGNLSQVHKKDDSDFVKAIFKDTKFVSISKSQAQNTPWRLKWVANVYNGIEVEKFEYSGKPQDYFAWLGRFTPDKGAVESILAARRAGVKLVMAGKVDQFVPKDVDYFNNKVKPLIDGHQIKYIGEVNHLKKVKLLKNSRALIDAIRWNEPFGLVMTEAMACGAPVIANRRGSVPEVVANGKTGFITNTQDDIVAAIKNIGQIDRMACRRRVEEYFSAEKMARGYEEVYYNILKHEA